MNAQAGYLRQLKDFAVRFSLTGAPLPVICNGDIFNYWNARPEIVNLLIQHMPRMYAVPGQHDLPNHNYEQIHRSAYGTLVEAGIVTNLRYGKPHFISGFKLALHGFPWASDLRPLDKRVSDEIHIAVVHKYVWLGDAKHDKAKEEDHGSVVLKELGGYDVVLLGDNHKPWSSVGGSTYFNCGPFMARHSDEKPADFYPSVGIIFSDGRVRRVYLDVSKDKWRETPAAEPEPVSDVDYGQLAEDLAKLEIKLCNFRHAVTHLGKDLDEDVKAFIDSLLQKLGRK